MKTLLKKYKYPFIIFLILATVYTVVISWHQGIEKGLRELYPLEKSGNKAASNAFIEAQVYYTYIESLHPYFDYDSIIMKPFLSRMNMYFEEGKSLLPKESIEDILWWVGLYKNIYGFGVPPRNDNSLVYDRLPPEEFIKVHDKVYEMIERFPYGINNFKISQLRNFRFQAYRILVKFFYGQYFLRYNPTKGNRIEQYASDKKAKQRLTKILKEYPLVKEKYFINTNQEENKYTKLIKNDQIPEITSILLNATKDEKTKEKLKKILKEYPSLKKQYIRDGKNIKLLLDYKMDMFKIAASIINREIYLNNQKLLKKVCTSNEVSIILKEGDELLSDINSFTQYKEKIFQRVFDKKYSNPLVIFGHIVISCPNLKSRASNIYFKIDQLNKEKYGENK